MLLGYALAILIALVCHEAAHAFAAYKSGDPSAKLAGRLTLNPIKHVDPIGLLCFCIAGIGWAKPVPVNPFNYRNFKRGNFWVCVAGILTNLALGLFFSFFLALTTFLAIKSGTINTWYVFGFRYFFYYATVINIMLMLFNLLPVHPLDGFNLLVSFTKPDNSYMMFMRRYSMLMLPLVLLVLIFTGALGYVAGGIEWLFMSFWGLMF